MSVFEGEFSTEGLKFGLIVSRFNEMISNELLDGANNCLARYGVQKENIDIARVPGGLEISCIALKMAKTKRYNALVCLGAIIRGETPHFDYVCKETISGISRVALGTEIPVIFGVLTTDTTQQALERAGIKSGNKGWEAALAAIEMANLIRKFD